MKRIIRSIAVGALTFISAVSCSVNNSGTVSISGSSTVLPVVSSAAEAYSEANPNIKLIINAGGSGVGISQLGRGQIDIGMMSRDIRTSEYKQYPDVTFNVHNIGRDAVIPVVSSEIYDAGVTALTRDQIAKIYLGEIQNWSEVGGPDKDIFVIDKEASRGTRQVFMEYILDDKDAKADGADLVLGSNNEEQTALTQNDAAIGMLSLAWLDDDVKGLGLILENGRIVEPTLESVVDGDFPIVRNLIVVTRDDASTEAISFVEYLQSTDGQEIVSKTGYIPVNPSK